MTSSFRSGDDAASGADDASNGPSGDSTPPVRPGDSSPPESEGDSIAWWDLKESRNPTFGVQLRAIAEIALAIDAARNPNLPRSGATLHPHGALITSSGRARLLPDLPLAALGDEERVLAPEVRNGGKPDARSDIFALGAMLYEALTEEPFSGGAEVRAELERGRANSETDSGKTPKWRTELLSLAARATQEQPSARGPQPRIVAKEILRLAGVDVAAPESLGGLVTEAHSGPPPPVRRRSSPTATQAVRTSSRPDGRYKSEPPPPERVEGAQSAKPPSESSQPPEDSVSSRPTVPGSIAGGSSSRPTVPGAAPSQGSSPPATETAQGVGMPAAAKAALAAGEATRRGTTPGMGTPTTPPPATASYPPPAAMSYPPPPATASYPPPSSLTPASAQLASRVPTRTGLARPQPELSRPARTASSNPPPQSSSNPPPRTSSVPPAKVPSRIPTATGMPIYRPSPVQSAALSAGESAAGKSTASSSPPASTGPARSPTPLGIGAVRTPTPSGVGSSALAPTASSDGPRTISSAPPPADSEPPKRVESSRPPIAVGESRGSGPPTGWPRGSSAPDEQERTSDIGSSSESEASEETTGGLAERLFGAPSKRYQSNVRLLLLGAVALALVLAIVALMGRGSPPTEAQTPAVAKEQSAPVETKAPAPKPEPKQQVFEAPAPEADEPKEADEGAESEAAPSNDAKIPAPQSPAPAKSGPVPTPAPAPKPAAPKAVSAPAKPKPKPKPAAERPAVEEPNSDTFTDTLPTPPLATSLHEDDPPLKPPPLAPTESKPPPKPKDDSDYGI